MSEHKCEGKVWAGLHFCRCDKTARYEHEGKRYCKTHHPPTVQEKLDARNKKWKEDWESQKQAMRKADEARAEMQRKAAAYDGLIAQRDALKQTLHDELAGNLRLRDLGGARPDEPMLTFLERIIAERNTMLEALKAMLEQFNYHTITGLVHDESAAIAKARAAIKAAEEGK